MSLGTFGEIIFCVALAGAVLWEGKDYEFDHKPMAQAMWADYEFRKCLDDCRVDQIAMCRKLQIPKDECPIDCKRCEVYKEKK